MVGYLVNTDNYDQCYDQRSVERVAIHLNDKALRVLCSLWSPNVPFLFLNGLEQFVSMAFAAHHCRA
jgi:hypothetical protein